MKLYVIDKEGWVDVHESESSVQESLEIIDIINNEYTVIDYLGYVYGWQSSSDTYSGYKLLQSNKTNYELLAKINNPNDQQFKI